MTEQPSSSSPPVITSSLPGSGEMIRLITESVDWKMTMDQLVPFIRRLLIFDNLAIYEGSRLEPTGEVIYARAVGRGRTSGEELSWGDATAAMIFESNRMEINQPIQTSEFDEHRLDFPYIIGTPIHLPDHHYVLVVIRFGGPEYTSSDKQTMLTIAAQIGLLLKQKHLNDRINELEKEKSQSMLQEDLISTISHELLSPIGFIKGYTTTLLRSDTTWNPEMQQEFLAIINDETDRLQELIDNLLDSARLQSGSLTMDSQPVRLDSLLRDVVTRTVMHQTNIKIQLLIPQHLPHIQGDSRRMTQVFENLISNCVKYAPGSKLVITAGVIQDKIHISFSDDGPGIAPVYLPNLFQKFFRSPDSSTDIHGTGLGLYISRQIITAHHGEIFAESELGKGTTVHILLPVNTDLVQGVKR